MRYRVTLEISEDELGKMGEYERITPVYRYIANYNDTSFIKENYVDGVAVGEFYDAYRKKFTKNRILRKQDFNTLVCNTIGCKKLRKYADKRITKYIFSR